MTATEPVIEIDCRLMEPPEPMVAVLEAVAQLQPGQQIRMIHRHRPMPLLPRLTQQGCGYRLEDHSTHVEVWIWKHQP